MKQLIAAGLALGLLIVTQAALAGDRPPPGAKPLSEIALMLEQQGYHPIVEIEMDDGVWEVEAYRDGQKRKLKVDPFSGEVRSDRRD